MRDPLLLDATKSALAACIYIHTYIFRASNTFRPENVVSDNKCRYNCITDTQFEDSDNPINARVFCDSVSIHLYNDNIGRVAMRTTLKKWGNSISVRLPNPLVHALGLEVDQEVEVSASEGRIIIEPLRVAFDLAELVARITPENSHPAIDTPAAGANEP